MFLKLKTHNKNSQGDVKNRQFVLYRLSKKWYNKNEEDEAV